MAIRSDARVFDEEELPTGKLATEQLDSLVARSLEKSTMFNARLDGPVLEVVAPTAPAAGPTQSSPEFLGKSAAVLLLPAEPVVLPGAAPDPAPPRHLAPPPVHVRRAIANRSTVVRRPSPWRHVVKLALLALVVVSQPWWWNVGDVHSRPPAAAASLVR